MKRFARFLCVLFAAAQPVAAQLVVVPGDRFRSWSAAEANLDNYERFYVVREPDDEDEAEGENAFRFDIDSFIVDALLQLGRSASSGEADEMPAGTQIKVTYESFHAGSRRVAGVTDLLLYFRDPRTDVVMALAEMEKVQEWPGPDLIASVVRSLVDGSVQLSQSAYAVAELTKVYEAKATEPETALPAFSARGRIRIVNAQPSVRWPIIYPMRTLAKKEYVDYRQLLDVAKGELEKQIREAGGTIVTDGADKTITLKLSDIANIAIMQTFLNFTVETGDGYVHGLQGFGKHWNYRKSVDAAVADATVRVLSDPNVVAYLAQ